MFAERVIMVDIRLPDRGAVCDAIDGVGDVYVRFYGVCALNLVTGGYCHLSESLATTFWQ
jgi:hypothetical protein